MKRAYPLLLAIGCSDLIGIRPLSEQGDATVIPDPGEGVLPGSQVVASPPSPVAGEPAGTTQVEGNPTPTLLQTFFGHYSFPRGPTSHRVDARVGLLPGPLVGTLELPAGTLPTERGGAVALTADGSFVYSTVSPTFWGDDRFEFATNALRIRVRLTVQPLEEIQASELRAGLGNGFAVEGGVDFGRSIANAGDVDGDGLEDLVVGQAALIGNESIYCTYACHQAPGAAYVLFGRKDTRPIFTEGIEAGVERGFPIRGLGAPDAPDSAGYSVAGAGDVDGNGLDDVLVGAPFAGGDAYAATGAVYLAFGKADSSPVQAGPLPLGVCPPDVAASGMSITHWNNGLQPGWRVTGGGDMNGDGLSDPVVGVPYYRTESAYRGAAHILYGQARGCFDPQLPSTDGDVPGFVVSGERSDYVGRTISNAGDFNGDGLDDLVIGTAGAGAAYILFGSKVKPASKPPFGLSLSSLANDGGLLISPMSPTATDVAPTDLQPSGAGDVNGDGFADLVIAAQVGNAPSVYVVFGRKGTDPVYLGDIESGVGGFVILGSVSDRIVSVAGAGDMDGDGYDDVILGGGASDSSGTSSSTVVFGKPDSDSLRLYNVRANRELGIVLRGVLGDGAGYSVSSADMNADGLDDLLLGAPGTSLAPGLGHAYVVFGWDVRNALGDRDTAVIRGPENDSIDYPSSPFVKISGGHGVDTLRVLGHDRQLDLRARVPRLERIEVIDLNGDGANTVILDDAVLRRLPESRPNLPGGLAKTLVILGEPDDVVRVDLADYEVVDSNPGRVVYGRIGAYYGLQVSGPSIDPAP